MRLCHIVKSVRLCPVPANRLKVPLVVGAAALAFPRLRAHMSRATDAVGPCPPKMPGSSVRSIPASVPGYSGSVRRAEGSSCSAFQRSSFSAQCACSVSLCRCREYVLTIPEGGSGRGVAGCVR